jgi:hypothetical protein
MADSAIWETRLRPFVIEFHDRLGCFTKRTFYASSREEALEVARTWALQKLNKRPLSMQVR